MMISRMIFETDSKRKSKKEKEKKYEMYYNSKIKVKTQSTKIRKQ